jgi:hypothetical protein
MAVAARRATTGIRLIGANHAHTLDRLAIQLMAAVIGSVIVGCPCVTPQVPSAPASHAA